jgi:hypothetical protein
VELPSDEEYSEPKTDNDESDTNSIDIHYFKTQPSFKEYNNSKKQYQSQKRKSNKSQNNDQTPWNSIMSTLQSISNRLDKIENNKGRKPRAHPRS